MHKSLIAENLQIKIKSVTNKNMDTYLLTLKVTIIKQRDLKWIFLNIYLKKRYCFEIFAYDRVKIGWFRN